MRTIKFTDLPREEQIDAFITKISGHFQEEEIRLMLALHAAFNMNEDDYFEDCDILEMVDKLFECTNGNYFEEEIGWNTILDNLQVHKIFDIIMNIDRYVSRYNRTVQPIDEIKLQLLESFVKG